MIVSLLLLLLLLARCYSGCCCHRHTTTVLLLPSSSHPLRPISHSVCPCYCTNCRCEISRRSLPTFHHCHAPTHVHQHKRRSCFLLLSESPEACLLSLSVHIRALASSPARRSSIPAVATCAMADQIANPEHKVSRYRSQRQKAQRAQEDGTAEVPPMPQVDTPPKDEGVVRSKSRYHRKRGNTGTSPSTDDQGRLGTSHGQDRQPFSHALEKTTSPPDRYVRPTTANAPPSRHGDQHAGAHRERHISPSAHPGAQELRRLPS